MFRAQIGTLRLHERQKATLIRYNRLDHPTATLEVWKNGLARVQQQALDAGISPAIPDFYATTSGKPWMPVWASKRRSRSARWFDPGPCLNLPGNRTAPAQRAKAASAPHNARTRPSRPQVSRYSL